MIYDLDNNPISSFAFSIASGAVQTMTLKIDCRTDYVLSSDTVADLAVEARKLGDVSWINIETNPIDLSADDGTRQTYEFRFTAGSVINLTRRSFPVRVHIP